MKRKDNITQKGIKLEKREGEERGGTRESWRESRKGKG